MGTFGGAVAWAGLSAAGVAGFVPTLVAAGAASIFCVAAGGWAERSFGQKDPGPFVMDEWAGFLLGAAVAFPAGPAAGWPGIRGGLALFIVFRALDAWKPGPIRWLERLPRGWGILLDDVAAGLVAGALVAIPARFVGVGA